MSNTIKLCIFAILVTLLTATPTLYRLISDVFWEPPTVFEGISLGMSRSDVIFNIGAGACSKESCKIGKVIAVLDSEEKVSHFSIKPEHIDVAFTSVEEMKAKLGDEDILSVHEDLSKRLYTYPELQISFLFDTNQFTSATIGQVVWGELPPIGEYFIAGEKICPGSDCPWDDDSQTLKPEYSDKSYADFMPI